MPQEASPLLKGTSESTMTVKAVVMSPKAYTSRPLMAKAAPNNNSSETGSTSKGNATVDLNRAPSKITVSPDSALDRSSPLPLSSYTTSSASGDTPSAHVVQFTESEDILEPGILHFTFEIVVAVTGGYLGARRTLSQAGRAILSWSANRGLEEQWERWKVDMSFWVWMAAADTGGLPYEIVAKWLDEDPVAKEYQYDNLLDVVEHIQEA
ncbi:hypothetical protein L198_07203 [Cryptococcus wingfieldii CBS 7118]|uniref:Uncharacterized protein n=1 Tax=Cryptococcus wingfieldii CBS 7118 TaxID=1295528 RepID=A0A1E3IE16_9TREE|nr:hypothetical protein L198_07203 [Cryptococcus wingfieldii CBS 7118]ODN86840.1 hypothetical protein L198_07203 [Cryptococcus wingfieldii CBS 7118]